jgi:hypothetical protein
MRSNKRQTSANAGQLLCLLEYFPRQPSQIYPASRKVVRSNAAPAYGAPTNGPHAQVDCIVRPDYSDYSAVSTHGKLGGVPGRTKVKVDPNVLSRWRLHPCIACFCCIVWLLPFVPQFAYAQKVASYDYVDTRTSERLRPPLPPPPIKHPTRQDPSHPPPPPKPEELGRGVCGGILGNPPLVVSILSLDRDSYAFGDDFIFVLQVRALYTTLVPVRASVAEVEPSDPALNYKWRPMGITMELQSPNHRAVWIGLLELYGSKDAPGSEIELKAGEWIELRGKARMAWSNPPWGTLQHGEEKWVIRIPLQHAQQFAAIALAHRAGSYRFDAETRQESQLCDYFGEQSSTGSPVQLTVTPKATPSGAVSR